MSKARKLVGRLALLGTVALAYPFLTSATPPENELQNLSETDSFSDSEYAGDYDTPLIFMHTNDGSVFSRDFGGEGIDFRFPHIMAPDSTVYIQKKLKVRRGNTLMELLIDAGLQRLEAYNVIQAMSKTASPRRIQAGQDIYLTFEKQVFNQGEEPRLVEMSMPLEFGKELVVKLDDEGYQSGLKELPTTALRMYASGTIDNSLYLTAMDEGVPLGVVNEMILLFSFDVDFQREIWAGDSFELFYERRLTADGEAEENGKILAATLVLRGRELTFYRHETAGGKVEFYTADGKSAKKMLMKTPIDGARLTSHFGSRKHPVLGYTRMHKGVDFGAPTGTPIMAAGDGVVERASPWGSYGNYLRIRHNGTYKTAYAHMSGYARGIKAGVRVRQGQVIGYVGATGRVTGRHLHYEILMNDEQVNPLTLKLPKGESLKAQDMDLFNSRLALVQAQKTAILAFYDSVWLAAGNGVETKSAGR